MLLLTILFLPMTALALTIPPPHPLSTTANTTTTPATAAIAARHWWEIGWGCCSLGSDHVWCDAWHKDHECDNAGGG